MIFADKRADFHRHSKELENALIQARKLINSDAKSISISNRLIARKKLTFLQNETRNLLFCARVSEVLPMIKKLSASLEEIRDDLEKNELAIEATPTPQSLRLGESIRSAFPKAMGDSVCGVTLILNSPLDKTPARIAFARVFNVKAGGILHSAYSIWADPFRPMLSSSFSSAPVEGLSWDAVKSFKDISKAAKDLMAQDGLCANP